MMYHSAAFSLGSQMHKGLFRQRQPTSQDQIFPQLANIEECYKDIIWNFFPKNITVISIYVDHLSDLFTLYRVYLSVQMYTTKLTHCRLVSSFKIISKICNPHSELVQIFGFINRNFWLEVTLELKFCVH